MTPFFTYLVVLTILVLLSSNWLVQPVDASKSKGLLSSWKKQSSSSQRRQVVRGGSSPSSSANSNNEGSRRRRRGSTSTSDSEEQSNNSNNNDNEDEQHDNDDYDDDDEFNSEYRGTAQQSPAFYYPEDNVIEQIGEEEPLDISDLSEDGEQAFVAPPKSALSRLIDPYEERKEGTGGKKKRGNKLLEMFFGDTVVRIRSRKIKPKSETGDVDLFAPETEEDEEIAKNVTSVQQTISSSIATLRSSSKQLFSKAVFKGVGVSFVKSIGDWKSGGVGVKVPITAHFPVYDSNICLPRLIGFLGVNYPFSYKAALTFSIPIQALQIFYYVLLRTKPVRWPVVKATDNVKRVGVTWSWKLNPVKSKPWMIKTVSSTVGPTFIFLPGIPMIKLLLPFMILTPALVFGSIGYLLAIYRGFCDAIIFSLAVDMLRHGEILPTDGNTLLDEQYAGQAWSATTAVHGRPARSSKDPIILENTLWNQFFIAWRNIEAFLGTKTPAFGGSASYVNKVLGGSVNFDIQPLYFTKATRLVVFLATIVQQIILYSLFYLFESIHAVNMKSTAFWQSLLGSNVISKVAAQHMPHPPKLEEVLNELSTAFNEPEEHNPVDKAKEAVPATAKLPVATQQRQNTSMLAASSPHNSLPVASMSSAKSKSDATVVMAHHRS